MVPFLLILLLGGRALQPRAAAAQSLPVGLSTSAGEEIPLLTEANDAETSEAEPSAAQAVSYGPSKEYSFYQPQWWSGGRYDWAAYLGL